MRRLREAGVLTLVVIDDAPDAVIGEEPTGPHQASLIRLDAEPEVQDRVHVAMTREARQHVRNRVASLATREIDRVRPAPARREKGIDDLDEIGRQRHQYEVAVARDRICGDDAPAPGGGHHHDVRPGR